MKTAISIPEKIFNEAEELAKIMGISRSRLFTLAIKEYLEENNEKDITRRLNELYADEKDKIEDHIINAQIITISTEKNKW